MFRYADKPLTFEEITHNCGSYYCCSVPNLATDTSPLFNKESTTQWRRLQDDEGTSSGSQDDNIVIIEHDVIDRNVPPLPFENELLCKPCFISFFCPIFLFFFFVSTNLPCWKEQSVAQCVHIVDYVKMLEFNSVLMISHCDMVFHIIFTLWCAVSHCEFTRSQCDNVVQFCNRS